MAMDGPSGIIENSQALNQDNSATDLMANQDDKVALPREEEATRQKDEEEKDEQIRKAAWSEMIAALKKAKEEKAEKELLAAEHNAAGLGDNSQNQEYGTKTNTLKNLITGP